MESLYDQPKVFILRAIDSSEPVEVLINLEATPKERFQAISAEITARSGPPDFPEDPTFDWSTQLGLEGETIAVWDFDYYQLSLRIKDDAVLLQRHDLKA